MTAADLLDRAQSAGLTLWREGDRLKYRGPKDAIDAMLPELREHKAELLTALPDPKAETRRQRVLEMLAEAPTARYAVLTHDPGEPEAVIVTLAIRGQASCELRIPRDRYDPFLLLDLIERHGATVH